MYPTIHHHADGHPGSIAATGLPEHIPKQPYVPHPLLSPHVVAGRVPGRWSTGLCHCCDDPANCFITWFCPCITFGQIAEIVSKGSSPCAESGTKYALLLVTGFACLYSCFYRSKLRSQYDLEESPCVDCLVHFCCETCALCQEYRDLTWE